MIDNFEQISSLLKFEDENEFYFIQVLQRNKENPELGSNNRLVKAYYIYSLEQLNKYKSEMIVLCQALNARLYLHLNRRNARMIALEMMEDIAHSIKSNQFYLGKIYSSVCGRHHSEKDKTWVIDVDRNSIEEELDLHSVFQARINTIQHIVNNDLLPEGDKILAEISTKNGVHLISRAFNSQRFGEIFPSIELHKNNPTILYIS